MTLSVNLAPSMPPINLAVTDSKPISVRIAKENEIDQINRSPQAKKLYNAQLIGGSIGVGLATIGTTIWAAKTKRFSSKAMKALAAIGIAAVASIPFSFIGAKIAKIATIFASTRGDKTEKV